MGTCFQTNWRGSFYSAGAKKGSERSNNENHRFLPSRSQQLSVEDSIRMQCGKCQSLNPYQSLNKHSVSTYCVQVLCFPCQGQRNEQHRIIALKDSQSTWMIKTKRANLENRKVQPQTVLGGLRRNSQPKRGLLRGGHLALLGH